MYRTWGLSTTAFMMIGGKGVEEVKVQDVKYLKDLTAFAWKADGSSSEAWTAVCVDSADVLCIARTHCLPSCL